MVLHKCKYCIYKTNQKCNLNRHLKTCIKIEESEESEKSEEEKKYNCEANNCLYGTNDQSNFNRHLKTCKKLQNIEPIEPTVINNNNNTTNNNSPNSFNQIGLLYLNGFGVDINYRKSMEYFVELSNEQFTLAKDMVKELADICRTNDINKIISFYIKYDIHYNSDNINFFNKTETERKAHIILVEQYLFNLIKQAENKPTEVSDELINDPD